MLLKVSGGVSFTTKVKKINIACSKLAVIEFIRSFVYMSSIISISYLVDTILWLLNINWCS